MHLLMMEKPACSEILSRMVCMTDHTGSFSSLSFEKNSPGQEGYRLGCSFFYTENRLINVVDTSIFTELGGRGVFDLPGSAGRRLSVP